METNKFNLFHSWSPIENREICCLFVHVLQYEIKMPVKIKILKNIDPVMLAHLKAGHEPAALRRRYPVANDSVHGRPCQAGREALHAAQEDQQRIVDVGGGRNAQAAQRGGQLRPAKHVLGAKVLSGHAADHLRQHVAPVERADDDRLHSGRPVELTAQAAVVGRGNCWLVAARHAAQWIWWLGGTTRRERFRGVLLSVVLCFCIGVCQILRNGCGSYN